uniref:Uncharacterized protein n=1 Tax=Solanum lycopersicum TaxID=4081 RepID=A0A3Q7IV74_SOLLC
MRLIDNNDYVKAKTSYKNTKASTYTIEDILKRNDPQEISPLIGSIQLPLSYFENAYLFAIFKKLSHPMLVLILREFIVDVGEIR